METLWRDMVAKDPGNVRAVMGLADAYALRGQCVEAIPYFERAQKLEPGDYKNTWQPRERLRLREPEWPRHGLVSQSSRAETDGGVLDPHRHAADEERAVR